MIRPRSLAVFLVATLACAATTARAASIGPIIYVSESIQQTTSDIVAYDTTATNPPPRIFASTTGLNLPFSLAFDAAGNLYAAIGNTNTIEKFSATGTNLGPSPRRGRH